MPAVTLFGLERSVYTRIARLALHEKDQAYQLREVEIFGDTGVPADHLQRHPFGRIPVLEHDGFRLFETAAIARYVDEAFAGPQLQHTEPQARALMNQTIGLLDAYAYRPMVWGVFVQRVRRPLQENAADEATITRSLASVAVVLDVLERGLRSRSHLAGDALTLADLHAYPMLRYFALAPEGAGALAARPELARWFDAMHQRGSVMATRTSLEPA
mgnify:CR=1 FL=1